MNYILAAFVMVMFLVNLVVSYLNYKNRNATLPKNVQSIYDKEAYKKWHQYFMDKFKFGMLEKTFSVLVLFLLLLSNGFIKIESYISDFTNNISLQILAFIGLLALASMIINIPFNYYDTFVIEEKYGFNKTTKVTFFLDFIKSLILGVTLGGGILFGVIKLVEVFENKLLYFVLSLWLASTVFMLLVAVLNTKVFVKIFNKLTPLEEGSLKDKIKTLSEKVGFDVKAIWVMDASKRSSKLNAFFSGFGKMKDVVLYDTLIDKMSEEEILSVLAHELGHAVHKDVAKMMFRGILITGFYILLLGLMLSYGSYSLGYTLIVLSIVLEPLGLLLGIISNKFSRKAEYKADHFSGQHVDKSHMVSALKVLAKENFSNLTPHPWYVVIHYSHPPISQRIKALLQ